MTVQPLNVESSVPLSSLADVVLGKMLQPRAQRDGDVEVPYLRSASIQDSELDLGGVKRMWASPLEAVALDLRAGDVVVSEGGSVGRAAVLREDLPGVIFQNSVNRLRPRHGADGRFLAYVLSAIRHSGYFSVYCDAVSIAHLTAEKLGRLRIPAADADAQQRIADYLDRETAAIDALIEKQMSLIAGLIERRRATISKSVVTGLHGSAVRCTGDTYFPRIADTWQLQPLGYGYDVVLGKMLDAKRASLDGDTELPYVRAANIKDGYLDLEDVNSMAYTPYEVMRLDLRAGDLLVVEGGSVGQSALLKEPMPGWSFQKTVNRVRSRRQWSTAYLHYVLSHMRARGHFDLICSGSTIAHLTAEKLRAVKIPVPPPAEQREIADHLDRETAKIDALIAKAERFIELAQERRAALISAAVTGQIEIPTED